MDGSSSATLASIGDWGIVIVGARKPQAGRAKKSALSLDGSDRRRLLHPAVAAWFDRQPWKSLRPIQIHAIDALTDANRSEADAIISAPTAGGKTMAALLPLLSRCLQSPPPEGVKGFDILYISPLKALINQQSNRANTIVSLAEAANDVHSFGCAPWNSDVDNARKRRIWDDPKGILLITPESIEGRLLHHPSGLAGVLEPLRFVIIDELHAYFDQPRGRHLMSLLARLEHRLGRSIPRICLSATLGNSSDAHIQVRDLKRIGAFIRPAGDRPCSVVTEHGQALLGDSPPAAPGASETAENFFLLRLKVLDQRVSSEGAPVQSVGEDAEAEDASNVQSVETWQTQVAEQITPLFQKFGRLRQDKARPPLTALVFANSRHNVETFTRLLNGLSDPVPCGAIWRAYQDKANASQSPQRAGTAERFNDLRRYWPHHGSLDRADRHHAEFRMASGEIGCVLVCTTTLELGIDVGAIENVVQIGAGPSVSSLRQRLGRSRRLAQQARLYGQGTRSDERPELDMFIVERSGDPARLSLLDSLRLQTFQALAQLTLLRQRAYESPRQGALDLSTLTHQILCVLHEHAGGGVSRGELRRLLTQIGPFRGAAMTRLFGEASESLFDAVLAHLRDRLHGPGLIQADPAPDGSDDDRLLYLTEKGRKFFKGPGVYSTFDTPAEFEVRTVAGQRISSIDVSATIASGDFITLKGKGWEVLRVDRTGRQIHVRTAQGGRAPHFPGDPIPVSDLVAQEMRRLYVLPEAELLAVAHAAAALDDGVAQKLCEGRLAFSEARLDRSHVIERDGDVYLFPWRGHRHIYAHLAALRACLIRGAAVGPAILLPNVGKARLAAKLSERWPKLQSAAPHELVRGFVSRPVGKFGYLLTPLFWRHDFVSDKLADGAIPGAIAGLQAALAGASASDQTSKSALNPVQADRALSSNMESI